MELLETDVVRGLLANKQSKGKDTSLPFMQKEFSKFILFYSCESLINNGKHLESNTNSVLFSDALKVSIFVFGIESLLFTNTVIKRFALTKFIRTYSTLEM